ncbi:MAG TPA: hypothetical protein VEC96_11870 [Anaerolineae bacterium]|nr:hypothetical protein [Anaerolineae bacterium]HXV96929.1 hypothetical protein [Anaerolineae bacterium]
MPTLPEILAQLQFLTQESALLGLFITAGIILTVRDWRTLILTLLIQYILVGLILSRLVRPDIAALKVMIGAFICPILFLSARQVSVSLSGLPLLAEKRSVWDRGYLSEWWQNFSFGSLIKGRDRRRSPAATSFTFRVVVVLLMILVAITLSNTFALPDLSTDVTTAVYWLVLAGLVTLTLTEDPMRVGHGLFTALTGFDLFYTTLEKSLLIIGLWGAVNLLLALAIGYLTVAKGAGLEEEL